VGSTQECYSKSGLVVVARHKYLAREVDLVGELAMLAVAKSSFHSGLSAAAAAAVVVAVADAAIAAVAAAAAEARYLVDFVVDPHQMTSR